MFSCELRNRITCFKEYLQKSVSIWCYFDTINLKQPGFCTTHYFNVLVSERKYKNNLKNRELKKKKFFLQSSYICLSNALLQNSVVFTKSENLCFLNLYSVHAARILGPSLEIMLSPPKWATKHSCNSKGFFFMPEQV